MSRTLSPGCGCTVFFCLAIGAAMSWVGEATYHDHWATCTVVAIDRGAPLSHDDTSSHYRVYTQQCGTLKNTDLLLRDKFDSADIQGRLRPGHTYRLHLVGARVPLVSEFPDILDAQEVPG